MYPDLISCALHKKQLNCPEVDEEYNVWLLEVNVSWFANFSDFSAIGKVRLEDTP